MARMGSHCQWPACADHMGILLGIYYVLGMVLLPTNFSSRDSHDSPSSRNNDLHITEEGTGARNV